MSYAGFYMTLDFSDYKKVHFIGIGGIGVSAIARMMMLEGKKVTGSDRGKSEITDGLKALGAVVYIGQKAENIDQDTDLVIYSIAITDDNPELVRAKELGIAAITYPQALGIISEQKYTIAVSGAHGKTTTTAMIAKVLIDAGLDPTVVVGSLLKDHHSNFIAGKSEYLVAEACEYRRSFLNLSPKILVITNIDDDHLDYYKDIEDIKSAFVEMIKKIPRDGFLVCDKEQSHIADVVKEANCTVVDYEVFCDQNLELKVPGEHNISNAGAVLAVADILGIKRKSAEDSLKAFSGTWRRFEYKGTTKFGAVVYDDYGHHPTEVSATIRAARMLFPDKRLTVVFQPHLYSRTKQHLEAFGRSFADADNVIIAPIYAAREPNDPSVSSQSVVREIIKNGGMAIDLPDFRSIKDHLEKELTSDKDVLLVMGAGNINELAESLIL